MKRQIHGLNTYSNSQIAVNAAQKTTNLTNTVKNVRMSNRKNLKISEDTYELLREAKGQYQTWDGFFQSEFSDD